MVITFRVNVDYTLKGRKDAITLSNPNITPEDDVPSFTIVIIVTSSLYATSFAVVYIVGRLISQTAIVLGFTTATKVRDMDIVAIVFCIVKIMHIFVCL